MHYKNFLILEKSFKNINIIFNLEDKKIFTQFLKILMKLEI